MALLHKTSRSPSSAVRRQTGIGFDDSLRPQFSRIPPQTDRMWCGRPLARGHWFPGWRLLGHSAAVAGDMGISQQVSRIRATVLARKGVASRDSDGHIPVTPLYRRNHMTVAALVVSGLR
jgi:hypothetical protein